MSAHIPVMPDHILRALSGCLVVCDGTFGNGGHSRALLEDNPARTVYAMDQDPSVQVCADRFKREFAKRFHFIAGNFGRMAALLKPLDVKSIDAVLFDLGVSSMQLDQPSRGFSFRADGPLDMRMSGEG